MQHTLVALVEDKPGVLNRVASLFRRLGALSSDPWEGFDAARVPAATIAERVQRLHP